MQLHSTAQIHRHGPKPIWKNQRPRVHLQILRGRVSRGALAPDQWVASRWQVRDKRLTAYTLLYFTLLYFTAAWINH